MNEIYSIVRAKKCEVCNTAKYLKIECPSEQYSSYICLTCGRMYRVYNFNPGLWILLKDEKEVISNINSPLELLDKNSG